MSRDRPLYDGHNRKPGAAKRGREMRNRRFRRRGRRTGRERVQAMRKE